MGLRRLKLKSRSATFHFVTMDFSPWTKPHQQKSRRDERSYNYMNRSFRLQKNPANFEIMTIREQLLKEISRKNWDSIVASIGTNPVLFKEVMQAFFSGNHKIELSASQVVASIADKQPELLKPYLSKLILNLKKNPSDAIRRNTMRIFQTLDIPEKHEGELFEKGISFLKSAEEPIAVKAFAMTVLRRICERYPELCSEVIPHIEILVEENVSAGLVNRGQKELKKLRKIQNNSK